MRARRARPEDAGSIYRLVTHYAGQGLLLPRTEDEIRAHIGRFLVLVEKANGVERILGCVALELYGADLAEIRSLAVDPEIRGRGLGTRLLQVALRAARRRKIVRVFAVTHAPEFFGRLGFATSPRWALPEKLARDCFTCPKAPTCNLVAVIATVCPERVALPVHGEPSRRAVLAAAAKPAPAL